MPQPFFSTLRSIETQSMRFWVAIFAVTSLLAAAWTTWFVLAALPVYAVSASARLEVTDAVHLIQAPASGRISAVHAALGRHVQRGDILVELDAIAETLQLDEHEARLAAIGPQAERLRAEIASLQRSARETTEAAATSRKAASARIAEAEADATQAADEATRTRQLHERGLVSEIDRVRAAGESERKAAIAETRRLEREQQWSEHLVRASELRVRAERLNRELLELEGQLSSGAAVAASLRHTVDERRIRAPIEGRIGQLSERHVGEFVNAGDRLAAIVPTGTIKVIAYFAPSAAIGRIQKGQSAHLRLEGFPWTQYGSLAAEVVALDDEANDQSVRVELKVLPQRDSRLPIRHGLPGTAVIEVERVSPATLVLRAAGHWLAAPVGAAVSSGAAGK